MISSMPALPESSVARTARHRLQRFAWAERALFRRFLAQERAALLRRLASGGQAVTFTVHFEDAGDGWVMATIPEVPGAISQGRTREEARDNVIDALQTLLTPDDQLSGQDRSADDESLTLAVC